MTQVVSYEVEQAVAIISIDNPPVNALGAAVRQGVIAGLDKALGDPKVKAIMICAEGRTFPAGADISEFGQPPVDPLLPEVCNRIEMANKPVVAAMHGTVLGGGFELALAAHYRVALVGTRIGLPEVTLGILPGAGGTQRAPRLVGAEAALDLMLSGEPIRVDTAEASSYIDALFLQDLRASALSFVQKILDRGEGPRPTRDRDGGFEDPLGYQSIIAARRKHIAKSTLLAPKEILNCVEAAALLPFEQGLQFERAAFEDCVASDQSIALRHMFFAERRAAKFPECEGEAPPEMSQVGILGASKSAISLAQICLRSGLKVTLVESDEVERQQAHEQITATHPKTPGFKDSDQIEDLAKADIVFETADDGKKAEPNEVDLLADKPTVVTMASSDNDALHEIGERAANVVGAMIGDAAGDPKLAEILVSHYASRDAVSTAVALMKRIGVIPVRNASTDVVIGSSVFGAMLSASELMLLEGATPYIIDNALEDWGMEMGPFRLLDKLGLASRVPDKDSGLGTITEILMASGRVGRSNGRGYYGYSDEDAHGAQDPAVVALIRSERDRQGRSARRLRPGEIQERNLAAMVNAGAKLLRQGVASCPSDIDVVMAVNYGFPRWRGGPMMAADLAGVLSMRDDLRRFAEDNTTLWEPDPVFEQLIKNGRRFSDLNG